MRRILLFALIFSFCCLGSTATAQTLDSGIIPFAGITLPNGDFGDDEGQGAGGATTGLNIGADYLRPMPDLFEGFSIVGTASLNVNPVDVPAEADVDAGYWFNVPVLAGGRYTTELSPTLAGFGQAQVGLNIARSPSFEAEEGDMEQSAATGMTLGVSFGAGVIVNDRFHVSLRYVTAGEPEFEAEVSSGDQSADTEFEQAISFLQLTIGMKL